ncbi:hypothetical protein EsH8_I_000091 [Colletotrichum jinshuiense]
MKFTTTLRLLAAASQFLCANGLPQLPKEPVCAAGITSVEIQQVQFIVRQPIYISAFLPVNTVLVLDNDVTLTITNAPMLLVTEIDRLGTLNSQVTRIIDRISSIPNAYVTITRGGHDGSVASTITIFPSGPGGIGTYLVYTPFASTGPTTSGDIPGPSPASIPVTIASTFPGSGDNLQTSSGPYSTITIGGAEGVPRNLTVVDPSGTAGTVFVQTFDTYSITVTGPQNVITVLGNAGVVPAAITLPDDRADLQTAGNDGVLQIIQTPGGNGAFIETFTTITVAGMGNGETGTFTILPTSGSVGAVLIQTPRQVLPGVFRTINIAGASPTVLTIPAPEGSTGTVIVQTTDGFNGPATGPFTTVSVGGGQGDSPATVTIPPQVDATDSLYTVLVQTLDPAAFTGPFRTITADGNSGLTPLTITIPPSETGGAGIVIIQPAVTPFTGPYTTITTGGNTGSLPVTLTVLPAGSPTLGTIIIQTPSAIVRPVLFRTLAALPIGGDGATVTLPLESDALVSQLGTIIVASGLGGADPATTEPAVLSALLVTIRVGMVLVQIPSSLFTAPGAPDPTTLVGAILVTITIGYTGSILTTVTVQPTAGSPGIVVVQTPFPNLITVTSTYSGSTVSTAIASPSNPGDPGTIVVLIPSTAAFSTAGNSPIATVISTYSGAVPLTTTVAPANLNDPTTVIVLVPSATGTGAPAPSVPDALTRTYAGSVTVTTTLPAGPSGEPGATVILVPSSSAAPGLSNVVTSTYDGSVTLTTTLPPGPSGQPSSTVVLVPSSTAAAGLPNVATSIYGGSVTLTTTLPPGPYGEPGSTVALIPSSTVTAGLPNIATSTYDGSHLRWFCHFDNNAAARTIWRTWFYSCVGSQFYSSP